MDNKFHLAFKVKDIDSTISFYQDILGCEIGRQTENWIDFDFFGHQLSAHVSKNIPTLDYCGKVENLKVPIPHFGCILTKEQFNSIRRQLENHKVDFIVKAQTRYKNQRGEQQIMFVLDFSNNPLEFKNLTKKEELF